MDYLRRRKLKVFEWPSRSPDLNIIENLCVDLKKAVHAAQEYLRTNGLLQVRMGGNPIYKN